jgi:Putative beta-barrel porin-2, OmpL-like. bbp2
MKKEYTERRAFFWDVTAFLCFGVAFVSGVVGSLVTTSWILNGQLHPWLYDLGLILLIAAIPLLLVGGHCLDLGERKGNDYERNGGGSNQRSHKPLHVIVLFAAIFSVYLFSAPVKAQQISATAFTGAPPNVTSTPATNSSTTEVERRLLDRITQLEKRIATLEAGIKPSTEVVVQPVIGQSNDTAATESTPVTAERPLTTSRRDQDETADEVSDFLRDTTFNVIFDGYYSYNFNRPVGAINLLRAYDVSSNSFSLNQAALVIESAPNLEKGKRYGLRLDLQYGQATETVQGNAANEPRPQVYRPLWQAYGTYVFDVGKGLTVDFGKFASSLGYETNYTKDNFNYSRSYFFNFLPFYHFGFRSKLPINDKVTVMYHLMNGTQQSEDFNGFKSHHIALLVAPTSRISGQLNYYFGQEQRDRNPALNPTFAPVASQPGLSTDVIRPVPSGRLHILDTYYTFTATDKLTLGVEGDYVVGRVFRESPPSTVWGGAGYGRYQWTPKFALAGRFEYLGEKVSPAGGLFSGVSQALKEFTFTGEYKFAEGFLGRVEYRRDFSNQPFFLTEQPGVLKKEQKTATLGLVWWFGRKKGTW